MFHAIAFILAFLAGLWAANQIGMSGSSALFFGILAGILNLIIAHRVVEK